MSGAFGGIARLDAQGVRAVQIAYDYVLDRWGVLVGTFRAGAVCACFAVPLLQQFFSADHPLGRLMVLGVWAGVFIPLIGVSLVRPHLEKDNKLQEARRFVPLNGSALLHQEAEGFFLRLMVFVLVCLIHVLLSKPDFTDIGSTALLMVWLWSRAVMVRDRDEARFCKPVGDLAQAET